ncbi:MAG: hypothetical protein K8H86_11460 [Ignavibacteriaceae bacterium]|nr:hypothetical protein [Ignavibacteriaceae bacterium]
MDITPQPEERFSFIKRWLVSLIILPIIFYLLKNRGEYGLIDNFDLVIHEAGHFFFSFFGNFIYTLGGTLMQMLIPMLFIWYFWKNYYRTGVQFSLLFLGQNLINISVYAADAQARKLPLLGGNKVYHDWHYILNEIGILQHDAVVGYVFVGLAIVIFIIALLMPLIIQD